MSSTLTVHFPPLASIASGRTHRWPFGLVTSREPFSQVEGAKPGSMRAFDYYEPDIEMSASFQMGGAKVANGAGFGVAISYRRHLAFLLTLSLKNVFCYSY